MQTKKGSRFRREMILRSLAGRRLTAEDVLHNLAPVIRSLSIIQRELDRLVRQGKAKRKGKEYEQVSR